MSKQISVKTYKKGKRNENTHLFISILWLQELDLMNIASAAFHYYFIYLFLCKIMLTIRTIYPSLFNSMTIFEIREESRQIPRSFDLQKKRRYVCPTSGIVGQRYVTKL